MQIHYILSARDVSAAVHAHDVDRTQRGVRRFCHFAGVVDVLELERVARIQRFVGRGTGFGDNLAGRRRDGVVAAVLVTGLSRVAADVIEEGVFIFASVR